MIKSRGRTLFPDGAICGVIQHDSREVLPYLENCVDLIVTSPPYADARRKHYDSIHPDDFVRWFLTFHRPFWDALKPDGNLVLNIKDKVVKGVRHRYVWHLIELLTELGWHCIDDYIWHKTNPMPGYWPTRLRDGWEYCFHLAKSKRPYMDQNAVRKPIGKWAESRLVNFGKNDASRHNSQNNSGFGRNISRWVGRHTVLPSNILTVPLIGKNKGHPAAFPPDLPAFFIRLLSPCDGLVVDPFAGSGMTGIAAVKLGRDCILIDNQQQYTQAAIQNLETAEGNAEYTIELITDKEFKEKELGKKHGDSVLDTLHNRHLASDKTLAGVK